MAVPAASESGGGAAEKGFLAKMKKTKRRMVGGRNCEIFMFKNNKVVFYGSQTGTAEEFAGRLAKEGARFICVLFCKTLGHIFVAKISTYFCEK